MAIERCPNGHYYNNEKFSSCPHCGGGAAEQSKKISEHELAASGEEAGFRTVTAEEAKNYFREHKSDYSSKVSGMAAIPDDDDDKTIAYSGEAAVSQPAAGWLVCTEGGLRGRDFTLRSGRNVICEYPGASLVSPGAAVIYDPKHNTFMFFPGTESAQVNGESVGDGTVILKKSDKIRLGDMELTFIPFCEGEFRW